MSSTHVNNEVGTAESRVAVAPMRSQAPALDEQPRSSTARRTIRSATSYEGAEHAVDWLSDQGFPVEHVSIVGTGLRYVEQVSGRLTTGRAAATGMGQGAVLGLFWGLLFSLFFTTATGTFLGVLAFSVAVGVLFGGVVGGVSHLATDGRRDFDSVAQTRADRYEVQIDDEVADQAERLLARMPSR